VSGGRCADLSRAADEPLAATATNALHWLLVEVRGGWSREVTGSDALPAAVSADADTNVVESGLLSNSTTEPGMNPAPFTVSVNAPVLIGDGVTAEMPGSGMIVADALPVDEGDEVLAARMVTVAGFGTAVGAR